ncbi:Uncharacterized protein Fot_49279 [Forsythia ovata]|uniref:Uncharacterized protein n=1 Tax=Forsythia ovata TaxID=205694 RepID=A0ABD1QD91_9LAMI
MGNFVGTASSPSQKKIRENGGEKELQVTTMADEKKARRFRLCKGTFSLRAKSELPQLTLHCRPPTPPKVAEEGRRVRIVVTKKQLELLIINAKKLKSRQIALQSFRVRGVCKKWRPSLATIPEL